MVMYYCDGCIANRKIGVGIVRIEKEKEERFSFEMDVVTNERVHEVVAVQKVLDIAKEKGDLQFTVFNDDKYLIKKLNNPIKRTKELDNVWRELQRSKSVVRYANKHEVRFIDIVHDLSRVILKGNSYKVSVPLEHFQLLEPNRAIRVMEVVQENELEGKVNIHALQEANKLYLTKYSKKRWVALTVDDEPIFASKDIVTLAHTVFFHAKQFHERMSINESFLKVLLETMNSGTILEEGKKKIAESIKDLLLSPNVNLYKIC